MGVSHNISFATCKYSKSGAASASPPKPLARASIRLSERVLGAQVGIDASAPTPREFAIP